jgi:hypothetical protein
MRTDAAAGTFVAALVLLLVSLLEGWKPLAVLCGVVMIGVIVATARRSRETQDPEVLGRPGDKPWRRPKGE